MTQTFFMYYYIYMYITFVICVIFVDTHVSFFQVLIYLKFECGKILAVDVIVDFRRKIIIGKVADSQ